MEVKTSKASWQGKSPGYFTTNTKKEVINTEENKKVADPVKVPQRSTDIPDVQKLTHTSSTERDNIKY